MTLTKTKPRGRHVSVRSLDSDVMFFARTRSTMNHIVISLRRCKQLAEYGWDWSITLFDKDGDAASNRVISVQP